MSRCRAQILAGALVLATGALATPARAAHQMRLRSSAVGAEQTVVATVGVFAFPGDRCHALVQRGKRHRRLPGAKLGATGGAQWTFEPARGVPAGKWSVLVTCDSKRHHAHAATSFYAAAGRGPGSARRLFDSSHVYVTPLGDLGGGSGGGTEHDLYPKGQCTWYVKQWRPDLPYFAGHDGDAYNWLRSAVARKIPTGTKPTVGAVAVWDRDQDNIGRYGHVALVVDYNDQQIKVSDMNYFGSSQAKVHWVPWAGLHFIYGGPAGNGPVSAKTVAPNLQPPPLAPLSIRLTAPLAESVASGTVRLAADSNAPAVRFDVAYYSDPSQKSSLATIQLTDSDASDGFAVNLDTTAIPNQGGPGGTSVVVTAVALASDGTDSNATSQARINVANTRSVNGKSAYPYFVVAACAVSPSCLRLRSGPGVAGYAATATKRDGEELDVVCQTHGEAVDNPDGSRSDIWDQLADGSWAFDYYVDTPSRGNFSAPIPLCPAPQRRSVVQYDCPDNGGSVATALAPGQYWRNDFVAAGDQISGGSMLLRAPSDGSSHRVTVGVYRQGDATDPVGEKTLTIPSAGTLPAFSFDAPLSVALGEKLYFAARAIDSVTVYDQPGSDGCIIGHLDGSGVTYPAPS